MEINKKNTISEYAGNKYRALAIRLYVCLVSAMIIALASLTSCAWETAPVDASDLVYRTETIEITGLGGEGFTVTPEELAAMDCVDREIKTKNSYGNEVKVQATGPLLSEFMDKRGGGVKMEDIGSVTFRAADGYKIELTSDELKKVKVILTVRYGDKPLSGDAEPLRLVTTGMESSYWVSGVEVIDFTLKE